MGFCHESCFFLRGVFGMFCFRGGVVLGLIVVGIGLVGCFFFVWGGVSVCICLFTSVLF